VAKDLTAAERFDVTRYEVGDVIRFGRAYKRLRIEKDAYLTVRSIDCEHGVITLLHRDGREIGWRPKNASRVEVFAVESRSLGVGDLVRWTRNDADKRRVNARIGTVVAIDRDRRQAELLVNATKHVVDLDREMHWEHGYASTVHAAQGRTADRVLLHIDTREPHLIGHESWYVGISRARSALQIFTDQPDRLPAVLQQSLQQESALEVVRPRERAVERAPFGMMFGL
jgi:ATP-dependent exoDNAse (exonuclease V) alpha subunit